MDDLMSRVLLTAHAAVFTPDATVDIHVGHFVVAERAVVAVKDLDPHLRVSSISRDQNGLMSVEVAYDPGPLNDTISIISALVDGLLECPPNLRDRIATIAADARTLSAWTCAVDGSPGWLVDTPKGPTVLCAHCQRERGLEVKRYEA